MRSTREIDLRIRKFQEVHKIVLSMKSIASTNVRSAQERIESLRSYAGEISESISMILSYFPNLSMPAEDGETLVVAYGSDQGLCGIFNEKIGRFVEERFSTASFIVVGRKLEEILSVRKLSVLNAPVSYEAIYRSASVLIDAVAELFLERGISEIFLAYNQFLGVGRYSPTLRRVFPFEIERKRAPDIPPILDLPPEEVLSSLIFEHLFSEIYRAYLESFLAENGVRLMNMNNASNSIERTLEDLRVERNYYRQEELTAQMQEILSAFRVLGDQG